MAKERAAVGGLGAEGQLKRVILSCMVGNALEWYDFVLYGYFAQIIGKLFFPPSDEVSTLLKSFGIFVAGFVMRPLGAMIFGYIGDRKGRKRALLLSIYLMAIPTTVIGLLPTYAHIGWLAPLGLTCLRLLQGISMGGEFTGSMVFIVEHSGNRSRGFMGSWASFSVLLGVIVGSAFAYGISHILSPEDLESWGWRIPFVLSFLGSLLGAYMRNSLEDTHSFLQFNTPAPASAVGTADAGAGAGALDEPQAGVSGIAAKPALLFKELIRGHWRGILRVFFVDFTIAVGFFVTTIFVMSYLQTFIHFSYREAATINAVSMVTFACAIPLSGFLCDIVGRRRVMIFAVVGLLLLGVPLFMGLSSGDRSYALASQMLLSFLMGVNYAPIPAILAEQFPASVRYSGISIAHNLSMTLFGGTAPAVMTWLIGYGQTSGMTGFLCIPGVYLSIAAFFSLLGVLGMRDRTGLPLEDADSKDKDKDRDRNGELDGAAEAEKAGQ